MACTDDAFRASGRPSMRAHMAPCETAAQYGDKALYRVLLVRRDDLPLELPTVRSFFAPAEPSRRC